MHDLKLAFVASESANAAAALAELTERYEDHQPADCDVVVVLGGDGCMLDALHKNIRHHKPIYGMNCGTVGFLLNNYQLERLPERIDQADRVIINPLRMEAMSDAGGPLSAHAINEVSLLRQTRQAANLRVSIDDHVRIDKLICDGCLLSTPAGSTAYNLSAHGPILPLGSRVLALTPISAFRPRRWRGAILEETARVRFEVLNADKRPVSAVADARETRNVIEVNVAQDKDTELTILFDREHNLGERILNEQFIPQG